MLVETQLLKVKEKSSTLFDMTLLFLFVMFILQIINIIPDVVFYSVVLPAIIVIVFVWFVEIYASWKFTRIFLEERHVTTKLMLPIRVIGVVGIGLVALVPALIALTGIFAFAMQNQPKAWAPNFGFPPGFWDFWLSGNQFYYNFLEFLAVGAGFTVIYLMYSIPELIYKEVLKKK